MIIRALNEFFAQAHDRMPELLKPFDQKALRFQISSSSPER
jgi:hypothetical protein